MKEVIINNENEGKRLDVFLTEILDESRSFILKNIKASNILVNDKFVKGGYLLKMNDRILIKDLTIDTSINKEDIPLDILYEDDDIIASTYYKDCGTYRTTYCNALNSIIINDYYIKMLAYNILSDLYSYKLDCKIAKKYVDNTMDLW